MPVWYKSILILLISASIAGAADLALLDRAMPEAKVFAGVNLAGMSTSPLGQLVLTQIESGSEQIKSLKQTTGFNLLQDVREILIASTGESKDNRSLVFARGSFPNVAAAASPAGAPIRPYNGSPLFSVKLSTADSVVALLEPSMIVVGDQKSVQAVVDRGGVNAGLDSRLVARAQEISRQYDVWMVGKLPEDAFAAASAPDQPFGGLLQGDTAKSVVEFGCGLKLGPDLVLAGEAVTKTASDAAALTDVLKFFIGIAQMSAQKDPSAASSMALLQNLSLTAEGNVAKMTLTIPAADVERLVQEAMAVARQQAATIAPSAAAPARQAPAPGPPNDGFVISFPRDMGTGTVK
jgi:hypothetical protein